jgi:hypothetical protein
MSAGFPEEPPAPHRDRVRAWVLLLGLAAGPAAWIAQMLLGYGISSYACYPHDEPHIHAPPPGWHGERLGLLVVNLTCLVLILAAFAAEGRAWRRTREEMADGSRRRLDVGEGRSRFLALCGMIACGLFALAVLFNTINLLGVPACWEAAP